MKTTKITFLALCALAFAASGAAASGLRGQQTRRLNMLCGIETAAVKIIVGSGVAVTSSVMCAGFDGAATAACEAVGGGPEDPFADACAIALDVAITAACTEAIAHGGKMTAAMVDEKLGCGGRRQLLSAPTTDISSTADSFAERLEKLLKRQNPGPFAPTPFPMPGPALPAVCSMDVKRCADGSYVNRDPSNGCQFRACAHGRRAMACSIESETCGLVGGCIVNVLGTLARKGLCGNIGAIRDFPECTAYGNNPTALGFTKCTWELMGTVPVVSIPRVGTCLVKESLACLPRT